MSKNIFPLITLILLTISCTHMSEPMVVKSLDEMILFSEQPRAVDQSAKHIMRHFKEDRDSKVKYLADRFDISNPMFMMEWGGGFARGYTAIIVTKTHLYYWAFCNDDNSFGELPLDREYSLQFKGTASKLKDYDGGKWPLLASDTAIFFMTFYEKNIPVRTFMCFYPRKIQLPEELKNILHDPLLDELTDLVDTIAAMSELKLRK